MSPRTGANLDGAFTRLLAANLADHQARDGRDAELAIRDLVKLPEPRRVKIEEIPEDRRAATTTSAVPTSCPVAPHTPRYVRPRQIVPCNQAKTWTLRSFPGISVGRFRRPRPHDRAHAVRKIEGLATTDQALGEELEVFEAPPERVSVQPQPRCRAGSRGVAGGDRQRRAGVGLGAGAGEQRSRRP